MAKETSLCHINTSYISRGGTSYLSESNRKLSHY